MGYKKLYEKNCLIDLSLVGCINIDSPSQILIQFSQQQQKNTNSIKKIPTYLLYLTYALMFDEIRHGGIT